MKIVTYISLLFLLALSWACQDVVKIETDETTRSLNVYGIVSDTNEVFVTLTITTAYFDQGANPPINDADIYLFEDEISVGKLNSLGADGQYSLDFQGTLGKSYYLEILLPASYNLAQNWSSQPEVLSRVFKPDSFNSRYLDRTTVPSVFDEGYYSLLYFQEPSGVGDNYRIRRWLNDSLYTQEFFIFDDANFDGADVGGNFPGFTIHGPIDAGDTAAIEISSMSSSYYGYLTLINEQVFQVGGPFDPPPSPIVGNIYNQDDPNEYGYGFFFASSQTYARTIVKP